MADSVLEKPLEFTITRDKKPGLIDRIMIKLGFRPEKIVFEIKRPTLRMNYHLTELFISLQSVKTGTVDVLDADWKNEMRIKNIPIMAKIVATYIHGNPKSKTPESLIDFVLDNVNEDDLLSITKLINGEMDIIPFTVSIALMKNLDVLSQGLKEASPADTRETIALGDSLETLQSISDGQ